tara:strand:- start:2935 stop:3612 length:678 start_codon:yes stop_codon:yes gene_type:complete
MSDQSALTTVSTGSVYSSIESFESAQRMAKSLAESDIVPILYRGKLGNCIVALEIANRMGMSTIQVMQNLNIIHGRPSWSSKFIIGQILGCGRFEGFSYDETQDGCQCVARLKSTGELVDGPRITMDMAKREGWTKNTKWSTMPQTMLRYRAASAFGSFHIPDLILGIQSVEENEVIDAEVTVAPEQAKSKLDKVAEILAPKTEPQPVPTPDLSPPLKPDDDFFD